MPMVTPNVKQSICPTSRWLSATAALVVTVIVALAGGALGYFFSWLASIPVYAATYNLGYVIRIQTVGLVIGLCLGVAKSPMIKVQKRRRMDVVMGILGVVAVLGSEWYFFGLGVHRRAIATIYRAGGHIERDRHGRVTAVLLGGRPYRGFSGDDFALLGAFPHMTKLWVRWPKVGFEEARQIGQFTQLESLSLYGPEADDDVIAELRPLVNLEELYLSYTGISDDGLQTVNTFVQLRTLDLQYTDITDAGVEALRLPNLRSLDLAATHVGDAGVAHLAAMAMYEDLQLAQTEVTQAGIETLSDQSHLRVVGLAYTRVSGSGFQSIKHWTRLESLNLNETNVNDEDLRWIAEMTSLRDLQLTGAPITDAGIRHCHGLSNLTYLLLNGTKVSIEAVDCIRARLPQCNVVKNH
jgi:hypothetical protein